MSPFDRTSDPAPTNSEADRYRLLVEAVSDYAIYMLDPAGVVTTWNAGAERLKGYRASEIVGRNFARFYPPEDQAAGVPAQVLETAARVGKFETEAWRVRKDGTRFWAFVVVDPIRDAQGTLLGFAKITRDLTERRQAEQALRRSEERFRRLVDGVTDYALYMLDPDGIVSNWNVGAQRIKGYTATEIVGQHFSRFYTDEDRARGEPARSLGIARAEGRFETEAWRVRKDGTRFFANVVIDAIRDEAGTLLGFAKITRDITERRETQLALDRTREALHQSQKMQAIGQLTGGVAHDFNNLLTVILSSLELLRRRMPQDDPRVARLLDNAVQAPQRGATLTQRMLAYARRQPLEPRLVSLPRLVEELRELLQRSVGPQIAVDLDFPADLPPVMADPPQLETALLNLAVNARDAMPEGGRLVFSAHRAAGGDGGTLGLPTGPHVCLSIADTGRGMDAATLARATEPFFTTKGVGKGTGLGLSMVQGMIEQLGGRMHLGSREGHGTTIELCLPVATQAAAAASPEDAAAPVERRSGSRGLRILTVDDDALVLAGSVAMLEDLGHVAVAAGSGEEALAALDADPAIDLVLTDYAMPGMTGADLARTIGRRWPGKPVVLATGFAELVEGDADEGVEGGAGPLPRLAKPYRQRDLAEAINAAML